MTFAAICESYIYLIHDYLFLLVSFVSVGLYSAGGIIYRPAVPVEIWGVSVGVAGCVGSLCQLGKSFLVNFS